MKHLSKANKTVCVALLVCVCGNVTWLVHPGVAAACGWTWGRSCRLFSPPQTALLGSSVWVKLVGHRCVPSCKWRWS